MNRFLTKLVAAGSVFAAGHAIAADDFKTLTIGDKAPAIDVEFWVQDNGGELSPVKDFEKDKVYIVEFWATWCGPCVSSMPHLAETQVKHGYDKVRLISISDEELPLVEKFLERKVPGDDTKTFKELTSVYSLTTDPDRSVFSDYMSAAAQNGIPTAFIVGKSGIIEWIGHPMSMDEPLEEILEDKWDREAFAGPFKKTQAAGFVMAKLQSLMGSGKKEDMEEALPLVETQLAELADAPAYEKAQLEQLQMVLLIKLNQADKAAEMIRTKLENAGTDLNSVMMAAQAVGSLPKDAKGFDKKALVNFAVEKIAVVKDNAAIKSNKMMQAQINLVVAQLYGTTEGMAAEAIKTLEEVKAMEIENEQLNAYIDSMLEQLKSTEDAPNADSK